MEEAEVVANVRITTSAYNHRIIALPSSSSSSSSSRPSLHPPPYLLPTFFLLLLLFLLLLPSIPSPFPPLSSPPPLSPSPLFPLPPPLPLPPLPPAVFSACRKYNCLIVLSQIQQIKYYLLFLPNITYCSCQILPIVPVIRVDHGTQLLPLMEIFMGKTLVG